jgi:hypothetical protein
MSTSIASDASVHSRLTRTRYRFSIHHAVVVLAIVAVGLLLRLKRLEAAPLWVDEAESSINALTILQHGDPIDRYLGQPIFENTLSEPWPESKEYEFRDSSYSSRGLAIYHGWLPLYSIAASEALFGIRPDTNPSSVRVQHDAHARRLRTIVPRLPAVLFGLFSMLGFYAAGRILSGPGTGLIALVGYAFSTATGAIDAQARYYAATVTCTVLCCLVSWLMLSRNRWRDVFAGALVFSLLFYTHLLSFAAYVLTFVGFYAVQLVRRKKGFSRIAVFGALLTAATLPWILYSGFLGQRSHLPRAWDLMQFPRDLVMYPAQRLPFALAIAFGLVTLSALAFVPRLRAAWPKNSLPLEAVAFLAALLAVVYFAFLYCMPAASFFYGRLTLSLIAPGYLLLAIIFSSIGGLISKRFAVGTGVALFLLLLLGTLHLVPDFRKETSDVQWRELDLCLNHLDNMHLKPGTRIYATPNDHLILTYYTGIPVQSVAPIRKEFLDTYPNEIVFIARTGEIEDTDDPLQEIAIRMAAPWIGLKAPNKTLLLPDLWSTNDLRVKLSKRVRVVNPPPVRIPLSAIPLLQQRQSLLKQREDQLEAFSRDMVTTRGYTIRTWTEWWPVFFYRFVHPELRINEKANYAERMRRSEATLISGTDWIIYKSPG